jgi:CRISPR/Cas system-associated exonuclease Cas4 (RecB family)
MYYWKRKAIRGHLWLREWRKLERTEGSAHYEFHRQHEYFLSLEKAQDLLLNQIRNTSDLNQAKELLILANERRAQVTHAYQTLVPLDKKRLKVKIKVSLKDAVNRRVAKKD